MNNLVLLPGVSARRVELPPDAKPSDRFVLAHIRGDVLESEGYPSGTDILVKAGRVKTGQIAAFLYRGRHIMSRLYELPNGNRLFTAEDGKMVEAPSTEVKVFGPVPDARQPAPLPFDYKAALSAAVDLPRMAAQPGAFTFKADADGRMSECGEEWTRLTGQSVADVLNWGWTELCHPDDRERCMRSWLNAVKRRTPHHILLQVLTPRGYVRREALAVPETNDDGQIVGWTGTNQAA